MNILIINCSPVRNGATAGIADMAAQYLAAEHEVRSICIDDYRIELCRGCRSCHETAECVIKGDDFSKVIEQYEWADAVISVTPSYWADVPGQFKVYIDRCTPWCDTHEPHAALSGGKRGYTIALRTGPSMRECERLISTIEHFYGHLHIECAGSLGLCGVEKREDVRAREAEILGAVGKWFG